MEALVAAALGGMFLTSVMSAWFFTTRTWKDESVRSRLRYQIEKAVEHLKEDVRLSDGNGILFYPQNDATYTAISLPRATLASNGLLTRDATGIVWDSTVMYYVYDNGSQLELRRTVYPSFNSNSATRQTQLDTLVLTGTGITGSTTEELFTADGAALEITSTTPIFDGYATSTTLASGNFGSIRLTAGAHEISFEVVGKNASSSGYAMGLDTLSLMPSGSTREVEALQISSDSGQSATAEDMTAYGVWGGNNQIEYASLAVGHYITFDVYYDEWMESNFGDMTHTNTVVSGSDPVLTLLSRESQSITPSWEADAQTGSAPADESLANQSVRCVIEGSSISRSGDMVRIKFMASSASGDLSIRSAYFGPRSGVTSDFVGTPIQLYFDNAAIPITDTDPVGATANPGTNTAISVCAGCHVWSNWFEYPIDASLAVPDHMVSLNVDSGNGSSWTNGAPLSDQSYRLNDAANVLAGLEVWSALVPAPSSSSVVFAVAQVGTWIGNGTATSQVYDTMVTSPVFGTLSWDQNLPVGASISLKVRSSANSDMSGASDWSTVASHSASPSNLGAVPNQRYVQFQADLAAASPFIDFPWIDDVSIQWPGDAALVELSGTYTKRPDYGMFKVLVDGVETVQALQINVEASEDYRGATYDFSLNAEIKPRNTGK